MIRLLFVDDDAGIRRLFRRMFTQPTYQVDVADSGIAALGMLEDNDYDAIVSDFRMPRMDGGEFLARACDRRPSAVRILVTAESEFDVAVKAVNRGEVFRLVRKPWDDDDLHFSIRLALEMRKMRQEREDIVSVLDERTRSLAKINDELAALNHQLESKIQARTRIIVDTLVTALDYRDPHASERARRIAAYARRLGVAMGLTDAALLEVEQGALLHDVGKLGIRDDLFFKRAPLEDDEWAKLRQHPVHGNRLLRPLEFLDEARRIVLHHRECWDGGGYPAGLAGEEIALGARIFAVAELLESVLGDSYYAGSTGYVVARAE
ncbi:MAG TPA: HD domain-containing phosphohydrolase, partial [Polyangiaceae bacterium]|nr:HD domain-containing phosphohydrolase [Polyangiaceae bacterium]